MSDRLSPLDVSFLYLEQPTTAMHVGSVMIFDRPETELDVDRLVRHIGARVAYVPRYRQRIRAVPGGLANPVWVDDEHFDLAHHLHRARLPEPGGERELAELVAQLQATHLDRDRPLWEATVVQGLSDGRFALVTKVHQAMVDGVNAVDLGQVLLDDEPGGGAPAHAWHPAPGPSDLELVAGAVADRIRQPGQLIDQLRAGLGDVRATAGRTLEALGGLSVAARTATNPPRPGPLNREIGADRRFLMVATDLADYRRVRRQIAAAGSGSAAAGATLTVNDIVLATLAGALRSWLQSRGQAVAPGSSVRALVPMSVYSQDRTDDPAVGSRMASLLVDLPTGEASPQIRVHQVAYQTAAHREAGQAVDAPTLAGLAGFAPPTLHSLGARLASGLSRRLFNLVVTNVPGPQHPLYLARHRLRASAPVIPLARGQALAVGLTSYDGAVHYGLNADRDSMTDLEVLGQCLRDALTELVEATR